MKRSRSAGRMSASRPLPFTLGIYLKRRFGRYRQWRVSSIIHGPVRLWPNFSTLIKDVDQVVDTSLTLKPTRAPRSRTVPKRHFLCHMLSVTDFLRFGFPRTVRILASDSQGSFS